jgi:K+ potassium transporter
MTIAAAALNPLRRAVVIGALGVVFGDIGTSPIYTFRECLKSSGNAGNEAVLGLLSLVFWALMIIVQSNPSASSCAPIMTARAASLPSWVSRPRPRSTKDGGAGWC